MNEPSTPALSDESRKDFIEAAQNALAEVLPHMDSKYANCGVCARLLLVGFPEAQLCHPLVTEWVGGLENHRKAAKYEGYSLEKANRLTRRIPARDVSSFQTRDTSREKYAGAIRLTCFVPELGGEVMLIFSASGIDEFGDEAVMLRAATLLPWRTRHEEITAIAGASRNQVALGLIAHMNSPQQRITADPEAMTHD